MFREFETEWVTLPLSHFSFLSFFIWSFVLTFTSLLLWYFSKGKNAEIGCKFVNNSSAYWVANYGVFLKRIQVTLLSIPYLFLPPISVYLFPSVYSFVSQCFCLSLPFFLYLTASLSLFLLLFAVILLLSIFSVYMSSCLYQYSSCHQFNVCFCAIRFQLGKTTAMVARSLSSSGFCSLSHTQNWWLITLMLPQWVSYALQLIFILPPNKYEKINYFSICEEVNCLLFIPSNFQVFNNTTTTNGFIEIPLFPL